MERELVFSGLVGMIDPPRDEVKAAVIACREAGIRPVMITGDRPATAQAIVHELGMMGEQDRVISAVELDRWSDAELVERVERIAVYARASAEHKLRIVGAWRTRGHVVAMAGD